MKTTHFYFKIHLLLSLVSYNSFFITNTFVNILDALSSSKQRGKAFSTTCIKSCQRAKSIQQRRILWGFLFIQISLVWLVAISEREGSNLGLLDRKYLFEKFFICQRRDSATRVRRRRRWGTADVWRHGAP